MKKLHLNETLYKAIVNKTTALLLPLWWDFILPRVRDGYDGDNKTIHELNKSACFTEHTLIYTKDGYKEIKDIEVGDEVYSENPDTREQGLKMVLNVFVKDIKELIQLKVGEQEIKNSKSPILG